MSYNCYAGENYSKSVLYTGGGNLDADTSFDSDGDKQPIAVPCHGDDVCDQACNRQIAYYAEAASRIDLSRFGVPSDPRAAQLRSSLIASGALSCEVYVTGECAKAK